MTKTAKIVKTKLWKKLKRLKPAKLAKLLERKKLFLAKMFTKQKSGARLVENSNISQ